METQRHTLRVGGVDGIHDRLLKAALLRAGTPVEQDMTSAARPPRGRGQLLRAREVRPAEATDGTRVVDGRQLLRDEGALPQALAAVGLQASARCAVALLRATATADALVRAGCETRPFVTNPDTVDARIDEALEELATAFERGIAVTPLLEALRRRLRRMRRIESDVPRVRVRLVGDLASPSLDEDDVRHVTRWLELRGAIVEPTPLGEWLLAAAPSSGAPRMVRAAIAGAWRRAARALALTRPHLHDPDRLAALARTSAPSTLPLSARHTVGVFCAVEREDLADLVLAFPTRPEHDEAVGLLSALGRGARTSFAAVTPDSDEAVDAALERTRARIAQRRAAEEEPRDERARPVFVG